MADLPTLDRTYDVILRTVVERGQCPHYTELARALAVPADEGRILLHELIATGLPNFLLPNTDLIAGFAPFSILPNHYRITVDGQHQGLVRQVPHALREVDDGEQESQALAVGGLKRMQPLQTIEHCRTIRRLSLSSTNRFGQEAFERMSSYSGRLALPGAPGAAHAQEQTVWRPVKPRSALAGGADHADARAGPGDPRAAHGCPGEAGDPVGHGEEEGALEDAAHDQACEGHP